MLELNVNTRSPAAITAALKKVKEMTVTGTISKTTTVHLVLEPGVYREVIAYNFSNPLIVESAPGTKPYECIVTADNCEAFHKGAENRSVITFGPNVTSIKLKNFTVANAHEKTGSADVSLQDAAEALCWNNTSGTLYAEGMRFEGRQNTLCLKGFTFFNNCYICGDMDFIYGEADTALFEECEIFLLEDNRGDRNGYVVKSNALANKNGFVFKECLFGAAKRRKGKLYVYRTEGKGSATSLKNWDSIALINCVVSELYNEELQWDDDHNLNVYPRGNKHCGWREYCTKTVSKNGSLSEVDTTVRNSKSYTLTEDDYNELYASRYLILKDTPFAESMAE